MVMPLATQSYFIENKIYTTFVCFVLDVVMGDKTHYLDYV